MCVGNPLRSPGVRQLVQGHHSANRLQNIKPKAAIPWTQTDVTALVAHFSITLDKEPSSNAMTKLTLPRDIVVICLLWETQSRGSNAGSWRLDNLKTSTGHAFFSGSSSSDWHFGNTARNVAFYTL